MEEEPKDFWVFPPGRETLTNHYKVISQREIIFWTIMLLLLAKKIFPLTSIITSAQ